MLPFQGTCSGLEAAYAGSMGPAQAVGDPTTIGPLAAIFSRAVGTLAKALQAMRSQTPATRENASTCIHTGTLNPNPLSSMCTLIPLLGLPPNPFTSATGGGVAALWLDGG